jgi:hypothetical protein
MRFILRYRRLLAALVIAIATSGNAQTRSTFATVYGTVSDVSGARVPGASIQLAHPGTPSVQTKTDGKGEFEITAGPGDYVLQTVARGFAAHKLPVHLSATAPTAIQIKLQLEMGSVCEPCLSIEPPLETLNASLSATLPLIPMPRFKQTSKKPHSPVK